MSKAIRSCLASALIVSVPLLGQATGWAQAPPAPVPAGNVQVEAGVEVQARGPIHEAFAQPAEVNPGAGPVVPKQPPDPIAEVPPDQRPEGADVQWLPGYWAWDSDRNDFLWVSGVYREVPPGRQWVSGYWTHTPEGWRWVSGFWAPEQQSQVPYVP